MISLGVMLVWGKKNIKLWYGIFFVVTMVMIILLLALIIFRQPQSLKQPSFQVCY